MREEGNVNENEQEKEWTDKGDDMKSETVIKGRERERWDNSLEKRDRSW